MKKKILAIGIIALFLTTAFAGATNILSMNHNDDTIEESKISNNGYIKTYFFSEVKLDGTAYRRMSSFQRIEDDEGWNNIWFGLYATLEVASGTLTIIPRFREPVTVYPGETIKISLFHGSWREIPETDWLIDQVNLEGLMVTIL